MSTTVHVMCGADYDTADTLELGFTYGHLSLTFEEADHLINELAIGMARLRRQEYGPVT
jgi:hypothetical protein